MFSGINLGVPLFIQTLAARRSACLVTSGYSGVFMGGKITPYFNKASPYWYCLDLLFSIKTNNQAKTQLFIETLLPLMNPWFLPSSLTKLSDCLLHYENFTQNIHPGLPFLISLYLFWVFFAFLDISSGIELVGTVIPSMQKLERLFWPPQRHIPASRSEKNLCEADLTELNLFWYSC